MSELAIRTNRISKAYRIGAHPSRRSLRETLSNWARAPQRLLRRTPTEKFWALHDVSLDVRPGEVLALIGRNGAGKTTLMKILARITRPTSGEAVVTGRVGSLLEVGTGFHPELTGRENTFLSGAILGMKKNEIERKFDEMVAFAEIEEFIDTAVKHYSSGMFVRLAFSVAAHLEPEILLVDEVLAVGDAAFQKKCLGRMGEVSRHGRTVLFISHNMSAVLNLCTRAVLLDKGAIVLDGPAPEVARDYLMRLQQNRSDDLAAFPDRRGYGRVRFTRAWFESPAGNVVTQVMSGETLILKVSYSRPCSAPCSIPV
jgi:lipopolysaccharide transport system ATP-binding protein